MEALSDSRNTYRNNFASYIVGSTSPDSIQNTQRQKGSSSLRTSIGDVFNNKKARKVRSKEVSQSVNLVKSSKDDHQLGKSFDKGK